MRRTSIILLALFPLVLHASSGNAGPGDDTTKSQFSSKADPRVTWGIDVSLTSGLGVYSGYGCWASVAVYRNLRVGASLIGSGYARHQVAYLHDSTLVELNGSNFLSVDVEYDLCPDRKVRIPIGIRVGDGYAYHDFRARPYDTVITRVDSYVVLEPWVGIRLNRGVRNRMLVVPVRMFSLAIAYRLPISPHHPDFDFHDLSGPVLYFRFSP